MNLIAVILLSGLLASCRSLVAAWQPDVSLDVYESTISADCTPRLSTVVNGTSPGPVLRFKAGQHVWIRVHNKHATENATIHFHGLGQYGSPFSDGTPLTAQWPIAAGQYFDYEFLLASDSTGTYFYHSHVGLQSSTAYGAFIVDEPEGETPPYSYDEDRILVLGDYYHKPDQPIIDGLLADPFVWLNEPQTLLVNGYGVASCNASALTPNQTCSTACSYGLTKVDPGKTYRLRFIGATILSYISLAIQGHNNLSLIEADAGYLKAYNVSHLEVASGQRYSALLTTKTASEVEADGSSGQYWIAMETRWRPIKTPGYAFLSYSSSPAPQPVTTPAANVTSPLTLPNETFGWIVGDLAPLTSLDVNGLGYPTAEEVTRRVILNSQQIGWFASKNGSRWAVDHQEIDDGAIYQNDTSAAYPTPFLVQLYTDQYTPNYTYALANGGRDQNGVYPVAKDEVLEVVIQNIAAASGSAEAHPWHQHGQHYWLIANGQGNWSTQATEAALANRTGAPFLRDTTVAYPAPGASYLGTAGAVHANDTTGWVVWRYRVETPGSWLVHCHIVPHMTMGMQTIWVTAPEALPPLPAGYGDNYLKFNDSASPVPMAYFVD